MHGRLINAGWLVLTSIVVTSALAGCSGKESLSNLLAPGAGTPAASNATFQAGGTITIPFDAANFKNGLPNPLFPLAAGTRWIYRQVTPDATEIDSVEVTRDNKTIIGVKVTVVHDVVYANGVLAEDTFDWYASDNQGNVWYFGEDTKSYSGGTVSTTGSWIAGANGAQPGIIMLAHPQMGDTYQQENSPGIVADMARVKDTNATAVVPYGTFTACLKTQEWTPLETGSRAFKLYAPGVGTVMEDENKAGGPVELIGFSTP